MPANTDIRRQFIEYFESRCGHTFVPSSPVVPYDDPTLLFANAGMNQFKDVFLGTGSRPYHRAVNTQKCIRAGGKHNDLEDVGKDTYHHTFFEMLGNWSFGDYFKQEAITWAWELLVHVWGLDRHRLHATVFGGDASDKLEPDSEAAELWRTMTDIDPDHIHFCGKKDNFWEMGETGPCGPCSEIHIDLTPDGSGKSLVNADDPRVIEIWNLVFIQYNRDRNGILSPLPAKHVDTGMGFERICAVLQGKTSNYDTDVFQPIFNAIRQVTKSPVYGGSFENKVDIAYRVISDHVRCLTFALTDGAVPGNEGRSYVLRRILRRAVRHGRQTFGMEEPFLYRLVPTVVETMGDVFPELKENPDHVTDVIHEEEESFGRTLDRGIALFEQAAAGGSDRIEAIDAFTLYDTYGFPLDLTQVMAAERGMQVDVNGFEQLMAEARERSRAGAGQADALGALTELVQRHELKATQFTGYDRLEEVLSGSDIKLFRLDDHSYTPVDAAETDEQVAVVLDRSPFYAESGGQVGDRGVIELTGGGRIEVDDTVRVGEVIFHLGKVTVGPFEPISSARLTVQVDHVRRMKIMANHTSTHMLNHALREHVSDKADQKGSLVDDERLRFDFSHNAAMTLEEIEKVEDRVNDIIAADLPVYFDYAPQEEAFRIEGLRAVFGEKYPSVVRIVSIGLPVKDLLQSSSSGGAVSVELCGGTHIRKTGDAEGFVVVSEEAVARGVRRITAITGRLAHQSEARAQMLINRLEALRHYDEQEYQELVNRMNELSQAVNDAMLPAIAKVKLRDGLTEIRERIRQIEKQQNKAAQADIVGVAGEIAARENGPVIVTEIDGADNEGLRIAMDVIRKRHPDSAMLLAAVGDGKVWFVASVPKSMISQGLKAGDWVREVAKAAGGGGGGRPDMAQAGGKDPSKLAEALEVARDYAAAKVN